MTLVLHGGVASVVIVPAHHAAYSACHAQCERLQKPIRDTKRLLGETLVRSGAAGSSCVGDQAQAWLKCSAAIADLVGGSGLTDCIAATDVR